MFVLCVCLRCGGAFCRVTVRVYGCIDGCVGAACVCYGKWRGECEQERVLCVPGRGQEGEQKRKGEPDKREAAPEIKGVSRGVNIRCKPVLHVCVCACVCVCARANVCACVCARVNGRVCGSGKATYCDPDTWLTCPWLHGFPTHTPSPPGVSLFVSRMR